VRRPPMTTPRIVSSLTGPEPALDDFAAVEPLEVVVDMVRSLDVGMIPGRE